MRWTYEGCHTDFQLQYSTVCQNWVRVRLNHCRVNIISASIHHFCYGILIISMKRIVVHVCIFDCCSLVSTQQRLTLIMIYCKEIDPSYKSLNALQISHNAPLFYRKYTHMHTFLLRTGAMWDITQVLCGIYVTNLSCVLYLIIIIKSEIWIINHYLGLGHEAMVCAVCLTMFLWIYVLSIMNIFRSASYILKFTRVRMGMIHFTKNFWALMSNPARRSTCSNFHAKKIH